MSCCFFNWWKKNEFFSSANNKICLVKQDKRKIALLLATPKTGSPISYKYLFYGSESLVVCANAVIPLCPDMLHILTHWQQWKTASWLCPSAFLGHNLHFNGNTSLNFTYMKLITENKAKTLLQVFVVLC